MNGFSKGGAVKSPDEAPCEKAQGPPAGQRSHGGGVPAPGKTGGTFPEVAAGRGSAGRIE